MVTHDLTPEEQLDRCLDAARQGAAPAPFELEPSLAATLRELVALSASPPPGARERIWQRLMPPAPVLGLPDPNVRRSRPQAASPRHRSVPPALAGRIAPLVELAAVAILLLALVGVAALRGWRPLPAPPGINQIAAPLSPTALAASPATAPAVLWKSHVGSPLATPPVVAGPLVFIASSDGQLFAVEAATGQVRGHVPVGQRAFADRVPAVAASLVYVCGRDGLLHALDAASGTDLWRFHPAGSTCLSSPVAAMGMVVIGSSGPRYGYLDAIDAHTGQLRWTFRGEIGTETDWTVTNGAVYLTASGFVWALDATSGRLLWQFRTGVQFGRPVVAGSTVYLGGITTSDVIALDAATGRVRWRVAPNGTQDISLGAIANGLLYLTGATLGGAANYQPLLIALDAATGQVRWRHQMTAGSLSRTPPAVSNGVVYAGLGRGLLYALDATTGAEQWHLSLGTAALHTPTVAGGVLYVGSDDQTLYAVRLP